MKLLYIKIIIVIFQCILALGFNFIVFFMYKKAYEKELEVYTKVNATLGSFCVQQHEISKPVQDILFWSYLPQFTDKWFYYLGLPVFKLYQDPFGIFYNLIVWKLLENKQEYFKGNLTYCGDPVQEKMKSIPMILKEARQIHLNIAILTAVAVIFNIFWNLIECAIRCRFKNRVKWTPESRLEKNPTQSLEDTNKTKEKNDPKLTTLPKSEIPSADKTNTPTLTTDKKESKPVTLPKTTPTADKKQSKPELSSKSATSLPDKTKTPTADKKESKPVTLPKPAISSVDKTKTPTADQKQPKWELSSKSATSLPDKTKTKSATSLPDKTKTKSATSLPDKKAVKKSDTGSVKKVPAKVANKK